MSKIQILKIVTLLLLVGGFAGLGQMHASAATYSQDDTTKIQQFCGQKLNISTSSKKSEDKLVLGACQEGYIVGLEHPNSAVACSAPYKKDAKALNACKTTGFNAGKSNPLKIQSQEDQAKAKAQAQANDGNPGGNIGQNSACDSSNSCDLVKLYVNPFINVLSIIIGLIVAGSLIFAGIQYSASSGDPQKTSAAKSRISNTLLALFAYAFLYAFLNFLVPGGLFH